MAFWCVTLIGLVLKIEIGTAKPPMKIGTRCLRSESLNFVGTPRPRTQTERRNLCGVVVVRDRAARIAALRFMGREGFSTSAHEISSSARRLMCSMGSSRPMPS